MSIVALVLIACIVPTISSGETTRSPLQVADLLSMVRISHWPGKSVTISPDGTRVAYVSVTPPSDGENQMTYDPRGSGHKQLWIVNLTTRSSISIGPSSADNWAPVWSPDGTKLVFYTGVHQQANIALWDASTQVVRIKKVAVAWDAVGWGTPAAQWTPDGEHVLVPQEMANDTSTPAAILANNKIAAAPTPKLTVLMSRQSEGSALKGDFVSRQPFWDAKPVDLTLVDIRTDGTTTIARGVKPTLYRLSPDGTKLFYTVDRGEVDGDWNDRVIFDIAAVDLRDGSTMVVAKNILTYLDSDTVTWSHDGSMIAFIGGNLQNDAGVPIGNYGMAFPGSCYVIDLHHPGVLRRIGNRQFDRGQGSLLWSNDDSAIYATTWDHTGIACVSLATGESTSIVDLRNATFQGESARTPFFETGHDFIYAIARTANGETQVREFNLRSGDSKVVFQAFQGIGQWTFSSDGMRTAYVGEDVSHSQNIWVADSHFARTRQVTHLNLQTEKRTAGVQERNISWHLRDGTISNGVLLLPVDYRSSKRYPTIVFVYAGEKYGSTKRNTFGIWGSDAAYLNLLLFATRGYAVFIPDSTLHIGHPMRDIANAILPGVDKIIAMGVADPTRLGVYGQSYGGYSVLSLIVQTKRFKVAVATSGIVDLISEYATLWPGGGDWTGWAESEQGRMGSTPWQHPERYIENSPFFYLDRVQTPVLLEYGSADPVANFQMPAAFVALRRLGKQATLVGYADENHVLAKASNQIDFTNRLLDWFGTYIHP